MCKIEPLLEPRAKRLSSRYRQRAGISQATQFQPRYDDGVLQSGIKRLKPLEGENGKLRKPVADLFRDKEMLQDGIR
ncbi:MAG: hypothetical protein E5V72_15265 [Mesorhizobium sp.]|nr:MAG: hypothetical protein EOQ82_28810 [Mesorhizobium sp.]TIW44581.1 MAG: hypothetical protein E5V72_15265 [Mesorhizobium sp.]